MIWPPTHTHTHRSPFLKQPDLTLPTDPPQTPYNVAEAWQPESLSTSRTSGNLILRGVLPLRSCLSASATSTLELRSQLWVLQFSGLCGLFIHTQWNYRPVREGDRCWLIIQKMHKYTFPDSLKAIRKNLALSSNLSWNFKHLSSQFLPRFMMVYIHPILRNI